MTTSPDLTVLRYLTRRRHGATVQRVSSACAMALGDVRCHLSAMEVLRLVVSLPDADATPLQRVYHVTAEGRWKVEGSGVGCAMPEGRPPARLGRTTAAILIWLAEHGPATALQVGHARDIDGRSMRGRLVMLARQGLVEVRQIGAKPLRPTYSVTPEGRRRAGIGDVQRSPDA